MDGRAGVQQHSEQEDLGGQEQGAFTMHRRSNNASARVEDGRGGGTNALFAAGSGGLRMGPGGLAIGGAPASPGSLSRAMTRGMGITPRSPATVSAPGAAPRAGAHMGIGGLAIGRAPASPGSLSRAMTRGTGMPPRSPATVSAPGAAPSSGAVQHPSISVTQVVPRNTTPIPHFSSRGVGGKRASAGGPDQSPDHDSNKQPRCSGPGTSASVSTGGRRKGQLREQCSTCHGCRTNQPRGNVRNACRGRDDVEGG